MHRIALRAMATGAALAALSLLIVDPSRAADTMRTELKSFNVTIRVFDPTRGMASGQDYVLPVDSPDEEHAIASTTANAASFTTKMESGKPIPLAFICVKIESRP